MLPVPLRRLLRAATMLLLPGLAVAQPVSEQPFPVLEAGMHSASIARLATDRSGRYAVSVSQDKTARVWSLPDGRLLQTLRVPLGDNHEGKLCSVAVSPAGDRIAVGGWTGPVAGTNSVYFFDRASGRLTGRIPDLPNVILHLAWSADGQKLALAFGNNSGIRVHSTQAPYAQLGADTDYGDQSYSVDFDRRGRLVSTGWDGKLRLYDANLRLLVPPRQLADGTRPFLARFSPDGRRIAVGFIDSTVVRLLSGADLTPLATLTPVPAGAGNHGSVAWATNGRRVFATGTNRIGDGQRVVRAFDPDSGRQLAAWPASTDTIMDLQALPDGSVAFASGDSTLGILDGNGHRRLRQSPPNPDHRDNFDAFRLSPGADRLSFLHQTWRDERWQGEALNFDLRRLHLSRAADPDAADPRELAAPLRDGLPVGDWRNTTRPTLNGKLLKLDNYEYARSLAIAADRQHLALGADWYIRWYDADGFDRWEKPVPGAAWLVNVSADGRFVVAGLGDGTIRWYRTRDGSEALALFVHADARRWVVWTPEGFFAASPDGEDLMGYVLNQGRDKEATFVSSGQLRKQFYRPDLIAKRIDGDEAAIAAAVAQVGDVRHILADSLPPEIELLSKDDAVVDGDYELKLKITPRAGGIGRVLLRKDGADQETGRDVPIGGIYSQRLNYQPGEYKLTVAVYNAGDRIPSESRTIKLTVRGATPPKPRLHVLAVGIGMAAYSDNKLATPGVEFADRDARAFVERIAGQAGNGRLYRAVTTRLLTSRADTSLQAIEKALTDIPFETGDTVVIFLAGHGKAVDGKYNFLPADLALENEDSIRHAAFTQARIESQLRRFGSGRALLVLDTCHAGAMTEGRGIDEAFAIDNLMRQSGQAVLAASRSDEQAFQDRRQKHGIFTLSLLDGLAAADYDRDNVVDVEELAKFLSRDVPSRSQKANPDGPRQTPMRSPTANSFPLVPVPETRR